MNIVDKVSNCSLLLDHVGTVGYRNWAGRLRQVHQVGGAQVSVTVEQDRSKRFLELNDTLLSHSEVLLGLLKLIEQG